MTLRQVLRLAPLLAPFGILLAGGVGLTVAQSLGVLLPVPVPGGPLEGYRAVLSAPGFWETCLFSLGVALASALLSVATGTWLGYALWRLPPQMRRLGIVYKLQLILPHLSVAFVVLLFWSPTGILASVLYQLGLLETPDQFPNILYSGYGLGMILAYTCKGVPFVMLLVLALLARFDRRQLATARMLGAGWWQTARYVLYPHLRPATHTSFIILFLYSFGAFDIPFILGESRPGMLSIAVFNRYFKSPLDKRPEAMAMLVIMFLFAATFIVLYGRIVRHIDNAARKL